MSNCIQSTVSLIGPVITGVKTGNIYHSGISYASNTIIKNKFGNTPIEYIERILNEVPDKKIDSKNKKSSQNLANNEAEYIDFISAVKKILK